MWSVEIGAANAGAHKAAATASAADERRRDAVHLAHHRFELPMLLFERRVFRLHLRTRIARESKRRRRRRRVLLLQAFE